VAEDEILIGELARRAGLRPSAIRYYEEIGLLPAPQRVAGRRRYSSQVLQRLAVVAAAQRAGLSLGEIRELLDADDCGAVSGRLREIAERKLPEVEALIERAQLVRSWLEAAADCRCPSLDACPLFDDTLGNVVSANARTHQGSSGT
jgi:MerR family redox-sensitive transcriptional activator SoxR